MTKQELAELDLAVAKALGKKGARIDHESGDPKCLLDMPLDPIIGPDFIWFNPTNTWSQGGPIIEEYGIDLCFLFPKPADRNLLWAAIANTAVGRGPTPLIAAMKAFVASKEEK